MGSAAKRTWPRFLLIDKAKDLSAAAMADLVVVPASLLDDIAEAILTIDSTLHVTSWNRRARNLFAPDSEGTVGANIDALVDAWDDFGQPLTIGAFIQQDPAQAWTRELDITPLGLDPVRALVKYNPTQPIPGSRTTGVLVVIDISGIKPPNRHGFDMRTRVRRDDDIAETTLLAHTQGALRASEQLYRTIVETANEGIRTTDSEGTTTYVNPRMADMLGYTQEEMIGQSYTSFLGANDQTLAPSIFQRRRLGIAEVLNIVMCRRDGVLIPTSVAENPVFDADHNFAGTIALVTDLTKSRQADEQIQFQVRLLDIVRQAVVATDLNGRITYWNRFATELYGWTGEEAIGSSVRVLTGMTEGDQAVRSQGPIAHGDMRSGQQEMVRKDGSRFPAQVLYTPVFNDEGVLISILGVSMDVTDRLMLEEQLRQSQKLEAIGTLAAGIAHDFNNLLTAITGYADLVLAATDEGDGRRDDAAEIRRAADRAAALTRQLLAFSRKQILQPVVLDLAEVLSGMQKLLRPLLREDIHVESQFQQGLRVLADQSCIEQILVNLVVNARDAMPHGGILSIQTSAVEIADGRLADWVVDVADGTYAMLRVKDTGSGMNPETISRIFEPFFTTKLPGQGTGLGLSTVYGMIRQSGGTINVDSAPTIGTCFTVVLPTTTSQLSVKALDADLHAQTPAVVQNILVVEDEPLVRRLLVRILIQRGYNVSEANHGEHAFELITATGKVDLIISDVVMPGMSGPQLVQKLKNAGYTIPVLFISGYTNEDLQLRHGDHMLEKPFSPADLIECVEKILHTSDISR